MRRLAFSTLYFPKSRGGLLGLIMPSSEALAPEKISIHLVKITFFYFENTEGVHIHDSNKDRARN